MTLFLFYTIGYIAAYCFLRFTMTDEKHTWTKEDRLIGLLLSIGSFLTIIIGCAALVVLNNAKDLNKPVKW